MLGNAIKQTTATTGTGALTTAQATGFPMLSDVFALNQPFRYALLDSSGGLIETGLGYLSASTTMVRAQVTSTFVSGVYSNAAPTPVSLSGTTTIICTPDASSIESSMATVDSQSASLNRFLTSADRNVLFTTIILTALVLSYTPFLLKVGAPIVSLSANVTVAGSTGAVIRVGIYACNEKGYMGALLATSGDIAVTTTGMKTYTLTTPLFLPPGRYFTAVVSNNVATPATITHYTSSTSNLLGGSPLGYSAAVPVDFRIETLASAVLPTTANTTTTVKNVGVSHVPLVFLGVA